MPVLVVVALVTACAPSAQSNADSLAAAASSTPPNMLDSVAAGTAGGNGGAVIPATGKTASPTTAKAGSSKSKPQSKAPAAGDTLIGYDSVIRFPLRTLPTATSTPTR